MKTPKRNRKKMARPQPKSQRKSKSKGTRPKSKAGAPPPPRAGSPPVAAAAAPAPGGENWDASVSDTVVLPGRCATNAEQRHVVLDHAVSNVWAAEDIGMIHRVESNGRCMWVMWRGSSVPPL
jgi:hypothetical protein